VEIFRPIAGKSTLWIAKAFWIYFAIPLLLATAAGLLAETLSSCFSSIFFLTILFAPRPEL
jgi:hypothetical protein